MDEVTGLVVDDSPGSADQLPQEERLCVAQRRAEFLSRIAHDLRSPLTTAMLMADLIGLDDTGVDQRREYLGILMQQLRREQEILEQLLTATRVEAGVEVLETKSLDIGRVVAQSIETVRGSSEANNIRVIHELPRQIPQVIGNGEALVRAFKEVLENAVSFTSEGGEVRVSWIVSDEEVAIVIRDSGPGIAPEDKEFLFEGYYRGAAASESHPGRPGLGLFVVKRVVEGLGGRIVAENAPQGGAQFEIHLPVSRGPAKG